MPKILYNHLKLLIFLKFKLMRLKVISYEFLLLCSVSFHLQWFSLLSLLQESGFDSSLVVVSDEFSDWTWILVLCLSPIKMLWPFWSSKSFGNGLILKFSIISRDSVSIRSLLWIYPIHLCSFNLSSDITSSLRKLKIIKQKISFKAEFNNEETYIL